MPFVVDNTNPTVAERARYVAPARAAGFKVVAYLVEVDHAVAAGRNAARARTVPAGGAARRRAAARPADARGGLRRALPRDRRARRRLADRAAAHNTAAVLSASSIAASVSALSFTSAALTFSCTCSGRVAPTITDVTLRWCSTQASASWESVIPASSAIGRSDWTALQRVVLEPLLDEAVHRLVGRARVRRHLLARLVLAGQHALGERRPDDLADAVGLAQRDHLLLGRAPERAVLRLRGDELRHAGHVQRRLDPVRRPLGEPDVPRLARLDDLAQRAHRLLQRRRCRRSGGTGRGRRSRSAGAPASRRSA